MCPVLLKIGPLTIYSYGLMLALAFFAATYLASRAARIKGISPDLITDFCFWVLISGIVGARLFYVLLNLDYYFDNPLEIIMLSHGGLAWYGGLVFAIGTGIFYLKIHKQNFALILDLIIPYVALGEAMGRIGCLLNGCCYGKAASWGLYFPVHKAVLIPTQLYSSIILLIIFLILRKIQIKTNKQLIVFFSYLIMHSIGRFFIEFLRADSKPLFLNLTIFQYMSIFVFLAGFVGLLSSRCKSHS
ncbi:MAG: prolipoprotein diacylglyceryl transferase [Candidatus Omnitrophota bacterium]